MSTQTNGYQGTHNEQSGAGKFNETTFLVNQILNSRNFATLVQIKAVTNKGGLSPVGFVDVLPLIKQLDGDGNAWPHKVIYDLPYFRLQGGANAVILDPEVEDIGVAIFADRDISAIKNTRKESNPGSGRRSSMADGIYFGGLLNGLPNQYVQFITGVGIKVVSPTAVFIEAPVINSKGEWMHTGKLTASVDVVGGGKSLKTHAHGGVSPGNANTGLPV